MRKFNWAQLSIYVLGYLVVFASLGFINLAIAGFDPAILLTPDYWFRTGVNAINYIIAFQLTMNLAADITGSRSKLYQDTETEIQKIGREQLDGSFADYISEYNYTNKRKIWIEQTTATLIKLTSNAPASVLEELRLPEDKQSRKTKRYTRKLNELKLKLTEPWIKDNLLYMKVIYPMVSPAEVVSGSNHIETKGRLIDTDINTFNVGKRMFNIGLSILGNAILNSIFLTGQSFTPALITSIILQFVFMVINLLGGYQTGSQAFNQKVLNASLTRREILVNYLQYKLKNKVM